MTKLTSIGEILFDVYPQSKTLGGASFNFIYHVKKLTGEGNFVSRVGQDENGKQILKFISDNDISAEYIQIDPVHPTGESIALLDADKVPDWQIKTDTAYDYIENTDGVENLINEKTDCLYFGTLAQRNIKSRETIHHFFNRDLKYFCDLNIRQNFYTREVVKECISACNILKLNIEELRLVHSLLLDKKFDTHETPVRLLNEYSIERLCVTYGDQGAVIYEGGRNHRYRLKVNNVIDTVGAGDAYASVFCIGYLKGWDIEKTNELASNFAGEIVEINGAIPKDLALYEKYKELIDD
jgi:fructokinase